MKSQLALPLEKHKRYKDAYGKNEVYWGLGVECESYFEMEIPKDVPSIFLARNHRRERYSVDYYASYKDETLKKTLSTFEGLPDHVQLPVLVNAHAITKMDAQLQHKTLYEKNTPPNPAFSGKTIFDLLQESDPDFFRNEFDKTFTFDGDSVEIMTQHFYNTTVEDVVNELTTKQAQWIERLRNVFQTHHILSDYGKVSWIHGNHGFAIMATNMNNLAIFNNGTYHLNITLPTFLNEQSSIQDWNTFVSVHKAYIRLIQWMEPILVAVFGSPDPLAWIDSTKYSLGSQRGAMSRYIGLGTYDTDGMQEGKVLTIDLSGVPSTWYTKYHAGSGYTPLAKVGVDINFHKHWNHGVELRFFDWFPPNRLHGLLRFLIYLGDIAMVYGCESNPIKSDLWNDWMVRVFQKGAEAGCTIDESRMLESIFHIYVSPSTSLQTIFAEFYNKLTSTYGKEGPCSRYFFEQKAAPTEKPKGTIKLQPEIKPVQQKRSRCF